MNLWKENFLTRVSLHQITISWKDSRKDKIDRKKRVEDYNGKALSVPMGLETSLITARKFEYVPIQSFV